MTLHFGNIRFTKPGMVRVISLLFKKLYTQVTEAWMLLRSIAAALGIFEEKILSEIFGGIGGGTLSSIGYSGRGIEGSV